MKFANQVPEQQDDGTDILSKDMATKKEMAGDELGDGGSGVTMHGYAIMSTLLQGWKDVSACI